MPRVKLWNAGRIEPPRGLGHPRVQQVRIALEGNQRVRMAGDGLDERDVGPGSDQARHARMPQVVEAVALSAKPGNP